MDLYIKHTEKEYEHGRIADSNEEEIKMNSLCSYRHSPLDNYCNMREGFADCDSCKVNELILENIKLKQELEGKTNWKMYGEEFPEKSGIYNVVFKINNRLYSDSFFWDNDDKKWRDGSDYAHEKVVAWMPFPYVPEDL